MTDLRRLLGYVRPYRGRFAAAVAASALAALFTGLLPVLVSPLLEELAPGAMASERFVIDLPRILGTVPVYLLILLTFAGKGIFSYLSQYLMSWVGERAVADLRADLGRAITHQSLGWFVRHPTGTLISRMTSVAEKVLQALSEKLYDLVREPLTVAALVAVLFWIEWPLAVVALVGAPAVILPVATLGRRLRRRSAQSQENVAQLASRLHEVVRGVRAVKAAASEDLESHRLARAARAVFAANMRAMRVVALTPPLMELLAGIGIAAAFFYGRARIAEGAMTAGEFLVFLTALCMIYTPVKKLSRVQVAFEQAFAAARRCFEVIDAPVEVVDAPGAEELASVQGEVRFDGVSFRYQDEWVLRKLDFVLPAGQVAALVGRSGAGKTTIANLILRFYDPSEGRVRIDGRDLRDFSLRSLRRQVGLVSQDVVLFNDTLAANIAYGSDVRDPLRIEAAARAAFAHDFIVAAGGYEVVVGEGGTRLSAGQRQRIAIARALLKDAPVLVLDEATSALDAESEALVTEALANLMRGRTTLVIAHRLATVRRADLILVVENGSILEHGTHAELLARRGGLYNRLAELQAVGAITE